MEKIIGFILVIVSTIAILIGVISIKKHYKNDTLEFLVDWWDIIEIVIILLLLGIVLIKLG
jgi:hypothetical protein